MYLFGCLTSFSSSIPLQVRLSGDVINTQLLQLIPNTEYAIKIFALYGEASSDALEGNGVTCA